MDTTGKLNDIKLFLDEKVDQYNTLSYLETDPLQIPHRFEQKEDIEISAFLTALITWGNRKAIIQKASHLMHIMHQSPYHWLINNTPEETPELQTFYYRTLNSHDIVIILSRLKDIISHFGSLENYFNHLYQISGTSVKEMLENFYTGFTQGFPPRTRRHIANIGAGSAGKRLNMFLRWMVRKDSRGVDLGIWNFISASELYIPLDVHSGRVARKLGLLKSITDSWKAVEELTETLRSFDSQDPSKYDYALFGLGVFEKF